MRLTDDHLALRASIHSVIEAEINPHVDEWERVGQFPAHDLFPKLGALGLLGLEYSPEDGGGGADHSFTMVACEALGRVDAAGVAMAINVQANMATPSLALYGTPEQSEQYLRPASARTAVAANGVTEPHT